MTLATLFKTPASPQEIEEFIIANEAEHNAVASNILATMGTTITQLLIRPFFAYDLQGWLIRHSTMHTQTNDVLMLGSNDLMVLELGDEEAKLSWFYLHAQEHRQWRITLGMT